MTTIRDGTRPDRRPDWLRRKHGHAPPRPRTTLDLWADKVVQILNGCQTGQHTTPWPDQARADEARKALHRAARRAGISVGAYLADPDTGKCPNCDRMLCQPSAKGQLVLHVNTFTKKDAYAYVLERYGTDTSTWPYIPGGRPPARPGNPAASPAPAAGKVPAACSHCHRRWLVPHDWQRFTCPACKGTVERHQTAGPPNRPPPRRAMVPRGIRRTNRPPDRRWSAVHPGPRPGRSRTQRPGRMLRPARTNRTASRCSSGSGNPSVNPTPSTVPPAC
jgi:hypothetical protein